MTVDHAAPLAKVRKKNKGMASLLSKVGSHFRMVNRVMRSSRKSWEEHMLAGRPHQGLAEAINQLLVATPELTIILMAELLAETVSEFRAIMPELEIEVAQSLVASIAQSMIDDPKNKDRLYEMVQNFWSDVLNVPVSPRLS